MISLSSLLLLEAGYIEAKSMKMPLPVPYSKYIFKESLSSLLRRSGLSEINLTNTKLSSNDDLDSQAYGVSKTFDVAIYLTDDVNNRRVVYNESRYPKVFVRQSDDMLSTFEGQDDGTYSSFLVSPSQPNDIEMKGKDDDDDDTHHKSVCF